MPVKSLLTEDVSLAAHSNMSHTFLCETMPCPLNVADTLSFQHPFSKQVSYILLSLLLTAVLFFSCQASADEAWDAFDPTVNPFPPTPEFGRLFEVEKSTSEENNPTSFLFVPKPLKTGAHYPLIVWLHGLGEIELEQPLGALNWLSELIFTEDKVVKENRFFVYAPRCTSRGGWLTAAPSVEHNENAAILTPLEAAQQGLDSVLEAYPIDPNRISVVGISAGATGAFKWAGHEPDRFALITLLAGGSAAIEMEQAPAGVVWQFSNRDDADYPLHEAVRLNSKVNSNGGLACLTVLPTGGHNVWNKAFLGEYDLLGWMLQDNVSGKELLDEVVSVSSYNYRLDETNVDDFSPPGDPVSVHIARAASILREGLPSLVGLLLAVGGILLFRRLVVSLKSSASEVDNE